MIEKEQLKQILYDPDLAKKHLSLSKYNNLYSSKSTSLFINELVNLIKQEIKNTDKNSININLIITWYDSLLKEYFMNSDTYMIFNNPLNEIICEKIIDSEIDITPYTEYICDLQKQVLTTNSHKKCLHGYLNYKNQKNITNEKFNKYVYALNELKCYTKDDYCYILNMILDQNYSLPINTYKNFFQNYCLFKLKEYNIEEVEIKILKFAGKERGTRVIESINGQKKKFIKINENYLKPEQLLENMQTLFHEMKHIFQDKEFDKLYSVDVIKRLEDRILIEYVYKNPMIEENIYYDENYKNLNVELDAHIFSRLYLLEILKMYAPKTYKIMEQKLESEVEKYRNFQDEDNRVTSFSDINNLHVLFASELDNHKEILFGNLLTAGEKSVLLQVYNTNCKPKTLDEYFAKKEQLLNQIKEAKGNQQKIHDLEIKLSFYNSVISTFKYNRENLARNLLALKKYHSENRDINVEVLYNIEKIEKELTFQEQCMKLGDKVDRNKK